MRSHAHRLAFAFASFALVASPVAASALDLAGSLGEAGGHTRYVAPVSSPIFNETPFITTEARPMWLHQEIPSAFLTGGGDIDVIAVQLRLALTDRLGFIATKDGWADIDFDAGLPDENGLANMAFGLKYAVLSEAESSSLLTAGARYEVPTGNLGTAGINLQGDGDGLIDLFVTGTTAIGDLGLQASFGSQLAIDGDHDTSFLHYSVHADYGVTDCVFPLLELNGYTPVDEGSRTAVNFEGFDLVNLGATDSGTIVTIAPGIRVRLHENVDLGAAFEVPLTDREDLMDYRLTTDFVLHL